MGTVDDLQRDAIRFTVSRSEYKSTSERAYLGEVVLHSRFTNLELWKETVQRIRHLRTFDTGAKEEILDAMMEEVNVLEERVRGLLEEIKVKDSLIKEKNAKIEELENGLDDVHRRYVEPIQNLLR